LINLYGPTEVSIDASFLKCDGTTQTGIVPIGHALSNVAVYILDERLRPVPTGVAGEICIGGAGLARGYLNRPDLTAEKFAPDSVGGASGGRLYRSGDLGRLLRDGSVEFLGRIDHQVKIHGFRIEPGEIESAISDHPGVREAAVLALDSHSGDKRLAAYVVARNGQQLGAEELSTFLKTKLPEHMIPSNVLLLDHMPVLPNGKLDRSALAALDEPGRRKSTTVYVAPRTQTEQLLATIWADVLGAEQVGINDDFFALGGHSLLATQVSSRMREAFRVDIPLRALFESPKIAALAQLIDESLRTDRGLRSSPIRRTARDGPLPVSYAQQRLWFLHQLDPDSPTYNIPAVVRLTGKLNIDALTRSVNELVRRHESLRTTFVAIDGQPYQTIAPAREIDIDMEDLRALPELERGAAAIEIAARQAAMPFDLSAGPLLRVKTLWMGEEDHVVIMVAHHIISDAWSQGILVNEVTALYQAFTNGGESPLPELEVQYADFARWQRDWLREDVLAEQLGYWKKQLEGAPPLLELPADRPRPDVQSNRGATRSFNVPSGAYQGLKRLSQRQGATLFMTLLAAFNVLIHRYTRGEDIVVGTDVANRNRVETEGLIGFFVNQLVLRVDLSGDPAFTELLARVRDVTLSAYSFQDLPFEMLVEALKPERSLSYAPLCQVKLVLQNAPASPVEGLARLTMIEMPVKRTTARLDLLFNMVETGHSLSGEVEYSTDLFDESTVTKMIDHFNTLLAGIVADPSARISCLRLLTTEETGGLEPSHFPYADLSFRELENLLIELGDASKAV
jgi:hypothetical protein